MFTLVKFNHSYLAIIALSPDAKDMAENLYRSIWSWLICIIVTVVVSLYTAPKPAAELQDIVYCYTQIPVEDKLPIYKRPIFWATGVAVFFAILQYIFW
jgi:SSS family solute:Na+ symporter